MQAMDLNLNEKQHKRWNIWPKIRQRSQEAKAKKALKKAIVRNMKTSVFFLSTRFYKFSKVFQPREKKKSVF